MEPDPTIARIREIRHRISEECGHDPKRLVEYYMKLEKEKYADRLVRPSNVPLTRKTPEKG
jgi:hypothetical protein